MSILELELADPLRKAFILDLVQPVLEPHDQFFFLEPAQCILRRVCWRSFAEPQLLSQSLTGRKRVQIARALGKRPKHGFIGRQEPLPRSAIPRIVEHVRARVVERGTRPQFGIREITLEIAAEELRCSF